MTPTAFGGYNRLYNGEDVGYCAGSEKAEIFYADRSQVFSLRSKEGLYADV